MSHNCQSLLCEAPHFKEHVSTCNCESCHIGHKWNEWTVEPECDGCLADLSQWIHENTDYPNCAYPDVCEYYKCDVRFQRFWKETHPNAA